MIPQNKVTSGIIAHRPGIAPQGGGGFSPIPQGYKNHIAEFSQRFPTAHLVTCGYNGNPKAAPPGWNTPTPHSTIYRHSQSALVGLIPASIGMSVVDVDQGNPLRLAFILLPEYLSNSGTPGRGHLWFHDDESRNNWLWEYTKDGAPTPGRFGAARVTSCFGNLGSSPAITPSPRSLTFHGHSRKLSLG